MSCDDGKRFAYDRNHPLHPDNWQCNCPRTDAHDCMVYRSDRAGIHVLFSEDPPPYEAEELCDCDCHIRDEDDEP